MDDWPADKEDDQMPDHTLVSLLAYPACLVYAPPGAGKTTAVTQALINNNIQFIKVTLDDESDFACRIGDRLGTELSSLSDLPQAINKVANNKDMTLVLDGADTLLAQVSKSVLGRIVDGLAKNVHLVFICSTFTDAAAVRRARAFMSYIGPESFVVSSPKNASDACWGWAAGIAESLANLQAGKDISPDNKDEVNLILKDCLEDYVWNHLADKQRNLLLAYALEWHNDCFVPFADARTLPALPMTRFEDGKVFYHEAYRLLAAAQLECCSPAQLCNLRGLLAQRQVAQGNITQGSLNAALAHDWTRVTLFDPFKMLYTQDFPVVEQLAQVISKNSSEVDFANLAMAKFVIRLSAACAIGGKNKDAQRLLDLVTTENSSKTIKREALIAASFIEENGPDSALSCLLDAYALKKAPSEFFDVGDLCASGINRLGFAFLNLQINSTDEQAVNSALESFTCLFNAPSLYAHYLGLISYLHCEFYMAKRRFQHALLDAEQNGSLLMQRAALEMLAELDTVQQNYPAAHRHLDTLGKLTQTSAFDSFNLDLASSNLAIYETAFDNVTDWVKNGDIKQGYNVACARWNNAFVVDIFYHLKRRRTIKAVTRADYLERTAIWHGVPQKEGCVLLIKACCELDLGNTDTAEQLLKKSYELLSPCGYLLPFVKLVSLETRYGKLIEKVDPSLIALLEDGERNMAHLHTLHVQAHTQPVQGPLSLLTAREFEVAKLAASGYQNKEIAVQLVITERTVKEHLTRTYKKLQTTDRRSLREKFLLLNAL